MTSEELLQSAIRPAFAMLPESMRVTDAEVIVLAICIQESGLKTRVQYAGGPARGFSQFERIAVRHVLTHPRTRDLARRVCLARGVPPLVPEVHAAFVADDILCMGFTRLNIYTSPRRLPDMRDQAGMWQEYLDVWRPGRPRPEKWPHAWASALITVTSTPYLT